MPGTLNVVCSVLELRYARVRTRYARVEESFEPSEDISFSTSQIMVIFGAIIGILMYDFPTLYRHSCVLTFSSFGEIIFVPRYTGNKFIYLILNFTRLYVDRVLFTERKRHMKIPSDWEQKPAIAAFLAKKYREELAKTMVMSDEQTPASTVWFCIVVIYACVLTCFVCSS